MVRKTDRAHQILLLRLKGSNKQNRKRIKNDDTSDNQYYIAQKMYNFSFVFHSTSSSLFRKTTVWMPEMIRITTTSRIEIAVP